MPGFPIRTSTDRSSVGSSPWLIAATHVLLRLQAPRHPPLALCSLENKDARARYGILKGRARRNDAKRRGSAPYSLRTLWRGAVAPSKRNRGSARLNWSPSREAKACDRDGSKTSRIASDQLRSSSRERRVGLLRKEVIQPHLPVRLPCYDFTPITDPTFDGSLLTVGPPASGVTDFRGVTGGVYKARERIHRSVADLRLLATPTSRSRVADCDPN